MRISLIVALVFVAVMSGWWLGTTGAAGATGSSSQFNADYLEFELVIGEQVYDLHLNAATEITTPSGESLQATFQRKQDCRFTGHGITFQYPGVMRRMSYGEETIYSVELTQGDAYSMLLEIYLDGSMEDDVLKRNKAFMKEMETISPFKTKEEEVFRQISGAAMKGLKYVSDLNGQSIVTEMYVQTLGTRTVALTFEFDKEMEEAAGAAMKNMFSSLAADQ